MRASRCEPSARQVLVMDIGGTTSRLARFDERSGAVSNVVRTTTPNSLTHPRVDPDLVLAELFEQIHVLGDHALDGRVPDIVVAGYPGPVTDSGAAVRSPTILGPDDRRHVDVQARLRRLWPTARVYVLNDLTCSGYFFTRRGNLNFCVVTVGSGIGNKVFLNGQPVTGQDGCGGEIGHLRLTPQPGSPVADVCRELGELASGRGTAWIARCFAARRQDQFARSALAGIRAASSDRECCEQIASAFRSEDPLAHEVVRAAAYPLAAALGAMYLAVGINRFFIVGGFAKALGESYRRLLAELARAVTWDIDQDWNAMLELGDDGVDEALLGAGYFATSRGAAEIGAVHKAEA